MTAWTPQARAAVGAVAAAERELASAETKLSGFCRLSRTEHAEREQLRRIEDENAAVRELDKRAFTPADTDRTQRLAILDKSVPACTAAIAIQREQVENAKAQLVKAKAALALPVLEMANDIQGDAIEGIRALLAQLAPHYAKFIAADQIVRVTLGERFPVPKGATVPMGGVAVVSRTLKPLPERLLPDALNLSDILAAAGKISGEIVNSLKKKEL